MLQSDKILKILKALGNNASRNVLKHRQDIVDGNTKPRDAPSLASVGTNPSPHTLSTPMSSIMGSQSLNIETPLTKGEFLAIQTKSMVTLAKNLENGTKQSTHSNGALNDYKG